MANIPVITLTTEWRLVPTTCEPCTGCQEIIYGKQYQLFLNDKETDNRLCEGCYEVVKEK